MTEKKKNVKAMYANEFLDEISNAEGDQQIKLLKEYGARPPLNFLFAMNFDKRVQLDLPPGVPPFKQDHDIHSDLFAPLASGIRRILNCVKTANVKKSKKEFIFIQMLEGINKEEQEILLAAKDRQLEELYPKVNAELVKKVFPQYFAE